MGTKIYGYSDDVIAFEGDFRGEVSCFGTDDQPHGVLVACSDGTLLEVKYGKGGMAIWAVTVIRRGDLFDRVDPCEDENASVHSDVVIFRDGVKWAMAATEWERVS